MLFSVCELKKLFFAPLIFAKITTLHAAPPAIVNWKLRARIRATITLPPAAILTFPSTFPGDAAILLVTANLDRDMW
jgi:hypothetical protein